MTTTPTQLPVPSETARDLKFNSGKIDEFVTSKKHVYIDRFGNKHRTIAGIDYDANQAILNYGYITKDSFEDGSTISLANECLRWKSNGEYYRWDGSLSAPKVVPPGSTPDSTGGIGEGKWVSVGDASLRSGLSKDDGASLVGWKDSTVGDILDNVDVRSSITPNVEAKVNLHFGTMHGNPFRQNEPGGTVQYNIASQADKGSYQITLSSITGLSSNQTIVYLCADDTYKTNVISSISGATINLKKPLQEAVFAGQNLWNFWSDRAHPNTYGFYAVADDAIEQLRYITEVEETILPGQLKPRTSGDTITILNNDDPEAPGCIDVSYARISASTTGGGCVTQPINLPSGMYRITGVVNSSVNSDISELLIALWQTRITSGGAADVTQQVANVRLSAKDCLTYFEFSFYAQDMNYQTIIFEPNTPGIFEVGKCEIIKVTDNIVNLNTGKHVLYGDSWINRGDIYNRLVSRLPKANIIKKGNSGWASDQLYADFDNQVTPEHPDFVWLMCSTNDYFRNYTVDKFSFEMGRIKQKIFDIKAHCICWDSTVGSNDDPDTTLAHNLTRSRQYALVTSYRKSNFRFNGEPSNKVRDTLSISESLEPNQEVLVGVFATTEKDVDIVYSAFENKSGAVQVRVGFSNSVTIPTAGIVTWAENSLKRPRDNVVIKRSPGAGSFCVVMLNNTSASALKIHGTIIAEYYPTK